MNFHLIQKRFRKVFRKIIINTGWDRQKKQRDMSGKQFYLTENVC